MMQTEGGTGHPGFMCHKQPVLEKHLRARLESYPDCDLRLSSTVVAIHEDKDWVYATYLDGSGNEKKIRGRFLVGADGKTGFTRKRYLEPLGVRLENVSSSAYQETWVALNWQMSLPTPESHPNFPLWKKGYTPQQVYDAFFPTDFRFLCNSERPAVCGRFGLSKDRLWRFEFVVHPGEDGEAMSAPDKIRQIVFPYVTHSGSRYGLSNISEIQYPSDCIEVLRSRPFQFAAKSCSRWSRDRVILCGDAAHVFPPFGGQGITSGFRDSVALAWRLVLATRQRTEAGDHADMPYQSLLDGWFAERKQQLDKSLASTIENGTYLTTAGPIKELVRDWYLWAVQLIPSWRRWLEQGNRREGMVKYHWEDNKGMAFLPQYGGGGNFPQVYCMKLDGKNKVQFTDDVIFAEDKKALFQIIVLLEKAGDLQQAQAGLLGVGKASNGVVQEEDATFIIHSTDPQLPAINGRDVYRLATGVEFSADVGLCGGRPEPRYYDPERMMKESQNKRFIILRPDRFVFAACDTADELQGAAKELCSLA